MRLLAIPADNFSVAVCLPATRPDIRASLRRQGVEWSREMCDFGSSKGHLWESEMECAMDRHRSRFSRLFFRISRRANDGL
jgi:hypothetical protein